MTDISDIRYIINIRNRRKNAFKGIRAYRI